MALNVDMDNNALDLELAKRVGEYFRLDKKQMELIIEEVLYSVRQWKDIADEIEASRAEQELMATAFMYS